MAWAGTLKVKVPGLTSPPTTRSSNLSSSAMRCGRESIQIDIHLYEMGSRVALSMTSVTGKLAGTGALPGASCVVEISHAGRPSTTVSRTDAEDTDPSTRSCSMFARNRASGSSSSRGLPAGKSDALSGGPAARSRMMTAWSLKVECLTLPLMLDTARCGLEKCQTRVSTRAEAS